MSTAKKFAAINAKTKARKASAKAAAPQPPIAPSPVSYVLTSHQEKCPRLFPNSPVAVELAERLHTTPKQLRRGWNYRQTPKDFESSRAAQATGHLHYLHIASSALAQLNIKVPVTSNPLTQVTVLSFGKSHYSLEVTFGLGPKQGKPFVAAVYQRWLDIAARYPQDNFSVQKSPRFDGEHICIELNGEDFMRIVARNNDNIEIFMTTDNPSVWSFVPGGVSDTLQDVFSLCYPTPLDRDLDGLRKLERVVSSDLYRESVSAVNAYAKALQQLEELNERLNTFNPYGVGTNMRHILSHVMCECCAAVSEVLAS